MRRRPTSVPTPALVPVLVTMLALTACGSASTPTATSLTSTSPTSTSVSAPTPTPTGSTGRQAAQRELRSAVEDLDTRPVAYTAVAVIGTSEKLSQVGRIDARRHLAGYTLTVAQGTEREQAQVLQVGPGFWYRTLKDPSSCWLRTTAAEQQALTGGGVHITLPGSLTALAAAQADDEQGATGPTGSEAIGGSLPLTAALSLVGGSLPRSLGVTATSTARVRTVFHLAHRRLTGWEVSIPDLTAALGSAGATVPAGLAQASGGLTVTFSSDTSHTRIAPPPAARVVTQRARESQAEFAAAMTACESR